MRRFPMVMLLAFALTLFTSATLLFLVQPMIGKMILPLLGGTPEVWNTCMVFFQAMLLGGYAYAHATTRWLGVRRQARLHLGVILVPALLFAVVGPLVIKRDFIVGGDNPVPGVLLVLLVSVGLPFFVVSTTSPLLQQWFSSTDHPSARDPYFLSTASNMGSMLALVGYPLLVEPFLTLKSQRLTWAVGYGLYVVLTGTCALLLWKSGTAAAAAADAGKAPAPAEAPDGIQEARQDRVQSGKPQGRGRGRRGGRAERVTSKAVTAAPKPVAAPKPPAATETALTGDVTPGRRLRWVLLAFVPSSLLMGVTTYMTTDIAAIPLLWVLPLGLYLLSFIIVFAKISEVMQSVVVFAGILLGLCAVAAIGYTTMQPWSGPVQAVAVLLWLAALAASFFILWLRDPHLIHKTMILVMPLMVLLLVFMMLSEIKPSKVYYSIMLHLLLMWVVAMVCHGEMVRDRPPTRYLTEFYMWMSFGGVLGGIFNALIAPVIFNSLAEYSLAMVLACLLLPPLTTSADEEEPVGWGRHADLILVGLFLLTGVVMIALRLLDKEPVPFGRLAAGGWGWLLAAVVITVAGGVLYVVRSPRLKKLDRGLDFALPLTLLVLTVGLVWGLFSDALFFRIKSLSTYLPVSNDQLRVILTYGLPAVLCYTFVERSLRFGLGVGAILLAGAFTNLFAESTTYTIFETRSFFGVLKVEVRSHHKYDEVSIKNSVPSPILAARLEAMSERDEEFKKIVDAGHSVGVVLTVHRLVHGTTLHGMQYQHHQWVVPLLAAETVGAGAGDPLALAAVVVAGGTEDYTQQALTYYHRTGPMGRVMRAFNRGAEDRIGVIGLGTGTLACYGRPGQRVVFYDIDKVVKQIAFDRRDFFTFVCDARGRGVLIDDMVLGDARLEIERWQERDRRLREEGKPRDTSQGDYAVLAVDAFSSDAIPIHLITREAVHLFMNMVREDGVLAYHISNRYLDLRPVLHNIARAEGLVAFTQSDGEGGSDLETTGKSASTWVVLARQEKYLERLGIESRWSVDRKDAQEKLLPLLVLPDGGAGVQTFAWALHGFHADRSGDREAPDDKRRTLLAAPWQAIRRPKDGVWTDDVWTDDYSNLLKVFNN